MGLYEKMFKVMEESDAIEKNMQVGSGKNSYFAISEAAVLNTVKPLLKKHKLIVFPVDLEITERVDIYKTSNTYNNVTTIDDKARLLTQLNVKWKIIDIETGESEILASPGNGADTQDKGSGKAWTYAYKALLQKCFMLFSGEDTDNTHSDDIDKKLTKSTIIEKPSQNDMDNLVIFAEQKGIAYEQLEEFARKGFNTSFIKINKEQYNILYKRIESHESKKDWHY